MNKKCKNKKDMQVVDMTMGRPLRLIFRFAVPMFIGNIFQQLYAMVDTIVVGHNLGDGSIAAIGASVALYSFLLHIAFGMNNGYGIVVSRCFGSHNEKELKSSIAGMMTLNVGVTLGITLISLLFLRPLLQFVNTPEEIFEQAYEYIVIICMGMICTICYNMFAAILRAMGNSRAPLYFLVFSFALNIVLDVVLVAGVKAGIAGAAVATVLSQGICAVLCGGYLFKNYRTILPKREDFQVSGLLIAELVSTGISMALVHCVVDFGTMIFQRSTNGLGESVITAFTVSRRIMETLLEPACTIAIASSVFAGQNLGAGQMMRIKKTLKKVLGVEVLWAVAACLMVWLFGRELVTLLTGSKDGEMLQNAVMCLRIQFSFYPAVTILMCLRETMQAIGYKVAPVLSSVIELVMKALAAAYLIPRFGFLGTSITEPITWVLMMVFLSVVLGTVPVKNRTTAATDIPDDKQ
ncbi:MATE family efflux transporter [Parablautia muri]|uniref:MATE family efflux transporter n=1 Tax=Parablautia muri TaxID=2320879 RepID=A0A9X5BG98_9FIRM|nr:MATE family efflux transporter [Parablautia muri]NBJ93133.1 MATE family efflux transporter [Parablautia muri]